MHTELVETNSHLADSVHAPRGVRSAPYATPVTPPPILQSQEPINYPMGPPPALNIPYQSTAAPNGSNPPSNCCTNCSGSRQTGNPSPVNAPKPPIAIPNPAAGNPNAPQIPNGSGIYPMPPRIVNNPGPLGPMALPPMPQRQNAQQMWNSLPHEAFNQMPIGPTMQRPGPPAMASFIPMIPDISGYEIMDLSQRPMNQGPPARYSGPNGPIPFGNGPPPPMAVRNPYEIQRPSASNGHLPSQSMMPLPINPPFQDRITPLPPPRSAYANFGPPPKPTEDLDLANQLGYLSISFENDNNTFSSKVTPKYLQEMYNDLNRLARQISPATTPFDGTATILSQIVGKFNLPHPSEWRLSIRCHSFSNGNTNTNETLLTQEDFPLYEYNKLFHTNKYPLFVLNYVGGRGNEILKHEFTFGLNNLEQEIQAMKARIIREKVGAV